MGVYEKLYKILLERYQRKKSIKVLSIDSTFIPNKNGTIKLGRNVYYKNKRGRKITAIVDEKGVPLIVHLSKGNKHDARIAPKVINKLPINESKEKRYILGDKAYDSKKIRELIRSKKYKSIISKRRYRNKNLKKMRKNKKRIYKKRIIVENFFSWMRSYAKIDKIYEKTIQSYNSLVLLAISMIIYKKN